MRERNYFNVSVYVSLYIASKSTIRNCPCGLINLYCIPLNQLQPQVSCSHCLSEYIPQNYFSASLTECSSDNHHQKRITFIVEKKRLILSNPDEKVLTISTGPTAARV